jgi:hypothetical protein
MSRYPITIDQETVQIGSAAELAVALDVLQGQYDRVVLTQLQPHLSRIIQKGNHFLTVMKSLSADDQIFLIQSLEGSLVSIMQDAAHLRDLLASLAEEKVETALLQSLGSEGLRSLILNAEELAEVLEWVYGQTDELALELLGLDTVRNLSREATDLSAILRSLDPGLQARLVDQLGWEFCLGLVRDGRDLAYLLRALPAAVSERLLKHYEPEKLARLIGNSRDWKYLYQRLEPEEADFITHFLGLEHNRRISHAA